MLFDLRGRGRQRSIRVIYGGLALLMGGGLVLFGIGSNSGTGGLLDAVTGSSGSSSTNEVFQERVESAEERVQRNRRDAKAWNDLARARYTLGADQANINEDGTLSDGGVEELRQADRAWTEHVKLAGDAADPNTAVLMIRAYGALGENIKAVNAAELFATSRNDAGSYLQYATVAYQADQTRTGDLAGKRAVALATEQQRSAIRSQVEQAKSDALQQQAQQAQQGATGATASTPLTPGAG